MAEVRACTLCSAHLPLGPRPVLRGRESARILIASQAPGTEGASHRPVVQRPFRRPAAGMARHRPRHFLRRTSGRHPRNGLLLSGARRQRRRPAAAPGMRAVMASAPAAALQESRTGAAGGQLCPGLLPQGHKDTGKKTLTETVRAWRDYGPLHLPLPHPSWRNTGWLKANPWFTQELLPDLRSRVSTLVTEP